MTVEGMNASLFALDIFLSKIKVMRLTCNGII
jgi:hypothetical protein